MNLFTTLSRCILRHTPPQQLVSTTALLAPQIRSLSILSNVCKMLNGQNSMLVQQTRPMGNKAYLSRRDPFIIKGLDAARLEPDPVVLQKFYRLNWGGWISTRIGRRTALWRKSPPRRWRLKQHALKTAVQSRLSDRLVGRKFTNPTYFINDIYEPYHTRLSHYMSRKIPKPFHPEEHGLPPLS